MRAIIKRISQAIESYRDSRFWGDTITDDVQLIPQDELNAFLAEGAE